MPEVKVPEVKVPEVKVPEVVLSVGPPQLAEFLLSHSVRSIWETRVRTLTRVPKRLIGSLASAWLGVTRVRLDHWHSDQAHVFEVLFYKCVLRVLPPKCRPFDVLRSRLKMWKEGRFSELWSPPVPARRAPAEGVAPAVPTRRVVALVEEGQLGAAIRALNADPPAPVDDESYKKMVERHPSSAPPVCPEVKSEAHVVDVRNAARLSHHVRGGYVGPSPRPS